MKFIEAASHSLPAASSKQHPMMPIWMEAADCNDIEGRMLQSQADW